MAVQEELENAFQNVCCNSIKTEEVISKGAAIRIAQLTDPTEEDACEIVPREEQEQEETKQAPSADLEQ